MPWTVADHRYNPGQFEGRGDLTPNPAIPRRIAPSDLPARAADLSAPLRMVARFFLSPREIA